MSRYHVKLTFDLDVADEEQAAAFAREKLHSIQRQLEEQGGQFESPIGESPEVAIYRGSQDRASTASVVALVAFLRGLEELPWVQAANMESDARPFPGS